jgi:hypothetical protein
MSRDANIQPRDAQQWLQSYATSNFHQVLEAFMSTPKITFPPGWGLVNKQPFTQELPDGNFVKLPESMKLPPELRGKPAMHHYMPVQRMGYPAGTKCWCGAVLEFNYHDSGMSKRRRDFYDEHDACVPPGVQSE